MYFATDQMDLDCTRSRERRVTDNFPFNLIDSVTTSNKPPWIFDMNETRPSLLNVCVGRHTSERVRVYVGRQYIFLGRNTLL